jgi:hypothetical protein
MFDECELIQGTEIKRYKKTIKYNSCGNQIIWIIRLYRKMKFVTLFYSRNGREKNPFLREFIDRFTISSVT